MTDEELAELYELLKASQRAVFHLKQAMIAYRDNPSEWNLKHFNRHLETDQLADMRAMIYPRFVRPNYDQYADRRGNE